MLSYESASYTTIVQYLHINGGEQDSYYPRNVNEFVAVFNNKEDALCCALAQDGCYVQKFKL